MATLRNGTYLRDPEGVHLLWYSPYSFNDAASNFRKRADFDDGWRVVTDEEEQSTLWGFHKLQPGEWVFVRGGEIVDA